MFLRGRVVVVRLLLVVAFLAGMGTAMEAPAGQHQNRWVSSLRDPAAKGNPEAQFFLGKMYAEGDKVEQDFDKAIAWYRLAAGQGHVAAMLALGELYWAGEGIERNDPEAAL